MYSDLSVHHVLNYMVYTTLFRSIGTPCRVTWCTRRSSDLSVHHVNILNLFLLVDCMRNLFHQNIWPTRGTYTYYDTKIWQFICSSVYQVVVIYGCVSLSHKSIPGKYTVFWDTIEVLWQQNKDYFPHIGPHGSHFTYIRLDLKNHHSCREAMFCKYLLFCWSEMR